MCDGFQGILLGFHPEHVIELWHHCTNWNPADVRIWMKLSFVSLAPRTVDPTLELNKLK